MSAENISRILRGERLHINIATIVGLFVAVVMSLFAVGYAGNPVKGIMQIVGVSLMVMATVNPRVGLLCLIVSSAYLDFLKRFLILFGSGTLGDVAGVLSVAPVILLGVFLGTCVLHPIFSKRMLDQRERRLVMFSLLLIGVSLISVLRSGNLNLSTLGAMANRSAYSLLIPIIYVLYQRRGLGDIRRLLVVLAVIYVPVAIYGIHQYIFGFSQFEIDYLRSGLTITETNLFEEHPRAFSTLNSPHSFSVAMGVLSLLSVILCSRQLRRRTGFFASKWRWLLPLLFVTACLLSFGRAGWIVFAFGAICAFAFRTRARITAFYPIFAASFGLLVWQADAIFASLDKIQSYLPMESAVQQQAFRISTYSERLIGFQNIVKNRRMWTWFGNPRSETMSGDQAGDDESVHDAIGQLLITHGIIGLLALAVGGGFTVFVLHRRVLSLQKGPDEMLGRGLLSICLAIFFSGMLTGSHLSVFPINLLFWAVGGMLVTVAQLGKTVQAVAPPASATAPPRRFAALRRSDGGQGTAGNMRFPA